MKTKEQLIASLVIFSATFSGRVSLLLFVIFLYMGSMQIVIFNLSEILILVLDGLLSSIFFIQHSWMIRKSFRSSLSHFIPQYYHDAAFTITSSIILIAVILFWQSSSVVLYEINGYLRWLTRGIFVMAIAGMGWGVFALNSFDPFGRTQIKNHLSGRVPNSHPFSVYGPYQWVRHPLYLFTLLLIWSCPDITLDRLLFNLLWSVWIIIGTLLEEKDLLSEFGEDYLQYQRKVPMLIPWKGRWSL